MTRSARTPRRGPLACMQRHLGLAALVLAASFAITSSAQAWCWFSCNYAKTKHPIVLAHGFLGADSYLGIIDYWYGIESYIEATGGTVYVTEVSPANSSAARGEASQPGATEGM